MLTELFDVTTLAGMLLPLSGFHPYPTVSERAPWEGLPAALRTDLVARGEKALATPWPALPATLYLEFARNGNRSHYQGPYFARRAQLRDLVLAECLEGKGRFLDQIANGVWVICEESSWVVPAHIGMQKAGTSLPDTTEPIVDLFAAETGALLAWTEYLVGPQLETVSPLLRPRLRREVYARIITPCRTRDDFWWMGFKSKHVNNWNPWVNSNWLTCELLLESEAKARAAGVTKVLRSLDNFITTYPADGGCDEGPGYWGRAGASLFDCLELLLAATGGKASVYDKQLIGDIGRFIYRVHLGERWYVNFADAPALCSPGPALVYRYGQRIGDATMQQYAAWCAAGQATVGTSGLDSMGRALPALFLAAELAAAPAAPALPRDVWLPDLQVMLARPKAGSTAGFVLAAKGGHNAESHNHNDVGHFLVYVDGRPVLVDAGVEEYTAKTFSSRRYEIWTMQSQYHNLPTVNGVMQEAGKQYAARELKYAADDARASLELELAGAWPKTAGLTSYRRRLVLERAAGVTLTDTYALAAPAKALCLNLLTPCAVETTTPGVVQLGERKLTEGRTTGAARLEFNTAQCTLKVEELALTDGGMRRTWGERLVRLVLTVNQPGAAGEIVVRVLPAPRP